MVGRSKRVVVWRSYGGSVLVADCRLCVGQVKYWARGWSKSRFMVRTVGRTTKLPGRS